jgi:cobaltochelatase CobN
MSRLTGIPLLLMLLPTFAASVAAAPARIAIIYAGGETTGPAEIRRATAPLAGDTQLTIFAPGSGGEALTPDADLTRFDLVFVDGSTSGLERNVAQLDAARARTRLVVVRPTATLAGNVSLAEHPSLEIYWANASQDNYPRLVQYLVGRVLGRASPGVQVAPPIVYPAQAFYHPDAPALFGSLDDYLTWYRARPARGGRHAFDPVKLTVGAYFHLAILQQKNLAHVDALVRAIEHRGHNAIVLFSRASPALADALVHDGRAAIDALLFSGERLNISDREAGLAQARRLGVPILSTLNQSGMTAEQFASASSGVHPALTSVAVNAEREGTIEPMVISGKATGPRDGPSTAPFPQQIDWRVDRALAWANLHRARQADKRVVFTYWSEGGAGKANAGGDPDDFLDVPASLVQVLGALRAAGYNVGTAPLPDRDGLARQMALEASNVGNWARGDLETRVRSGHVSLVPEATYRRWFDALPAARRAEVIEMWGPPPGNVMAYTDAHGQRFLVIPRIQLGNILIAPHPDWGLLQNKQALMARGALPPHHQYLAFFLWLQHEWHADAWVSLFSNIVLQPGKAEAPAADDFIAVLLGAMPHIHPERLGSNGGIGNKRKAMAQLAGWFNLVATSDMGEQLFELRSRLARYTAQPDAKLRADAEPLIRREIADKGLDRALGVDAASVPFADLLPQLERYLDELEHAQMPYGSKVLGSAPTGKALADMVTGMLGPEFRAALAPLTTTPAAAARALTSAVVVDGRTPSEAVAAQFNRSVPAVESLLARAPEYADRLRAAPREIGGILDALAGRWIEPGPMDEPARNPDSLPPGRSLYSFDQAAIPTAEAEASGMALANALIKAHREKHAGAYPTKLAFVLWSGEVAKTNGVTEAQILHLLGTRVVRNARGEVTGVELIPREELGRPRVDVLATTSGSYRDHYQDKVDLIAQATRLAASSPEPDNPVAAATRETLRTLEAAGEAPERATALANARVFSPAPGAYSPSIQFLAKAGDQRGDEKRMADLYTSRLSHAYGGGLYGEPARPTFEQQLARTDAATLPRSGNVNGMLDHPMAAGFLGGLNLAARSVTGKDIDLYVTDLRTAGEETIEPAARALQTELRTRYLNRAWLAEMKAHGYDGARNMMFLTDHLDLWNSTARSMVSSADWAEVKAVYVDDSLGLDLDAFFDRYNPHAQQVLLANLLGAASRGHWDASASDLSQLAARLARSTAEHGPVCEAATCRDAAFTEFVSRALANAPGGPELAAKYQTAIAQATAAAVPSRTPATVLQSKGSAPALTPGASAPAPPKAAAAAEVISGRVLEESSRSAATMQTATAISAKRWLILAGIALSLIAFGWTRPNRT